MGAAYSRDRTVEFQQTTDRGPKPLCNSEKGLDRYGAVDGKRAAKAGWSNRAP